MKATFFKKAAALCSAAALTVMGLSALSMTASAADGPVFELEQKTLTLAEVANYEDRWIPLDLTLTGNPGYSQITLQASFNLAEVTVRPASEDPDSADHNVAYGTPDESTMGPAALGLSTFPINNKDSGEDYEDPDTGLATYAGMAMSDSKKDGTVVTWYFQIPEDAQPGDVYEIALAQESDMKNKAGDVIDVTLVNGFIEIIEGETTTSATESEPEETTTSATESDAPNTDAPSTDAPDVPPAQTGDFGVGLVVAGLVAAAGAAVVLRKKED